MVSKLLSTPTRLHNTHSTNSFKHVLFSKLKGPHDGKIIGLFEISNSLNDIVADI